MKRLHLAPLLLGCLLATPAMADAMDDTVSGSAYAREQIRTGQDKAHACTTCHGLDGRRQGGNMPVIGGREYDHLLYEMGRYQRADRFHPVMTLLMQNFDAGDLADIATFFASVNRSRQAANPYTTN